MAEMETRQTVRAPPPGHTLPYSDGEPMESERHGLQAEVLRASLRDVHFAGRRDVYVAADMAVYFSELQAKNQDFRAPDFFLVLDTEYRERNSWVAWEEGGQLPDLVIEILSSSTEKADRGEKMRIYAKVWRLPEYFLVDVVTHAVEGYRFDVSRHDFVPIAPNARGDVRSELLGLSLGWRDESWTMAPPPWLRWVRDDGTTVPMPTELAASEKARADALAARVAELEAARK